ncbi:putative ABC transport system permease protein [Anaerosolibacter carboniphilus]|uniref:Putative ABC transport system permease protein n=1 Tax=Anaerosolibacter carboniphilus TaxID=1417629 RepID=A0A841KM10_9FIRM|nr:ABC transporter permease [Anaerosolibacter carboniphilus]MBB6214281.1 putative ABC transport system permease protein [Anaerosolibacter carboniphilus]
MTFHSIVYKNVKENFNKYVMYYLSNALVVMVFFIFANFIANPEIKSIDTLGNMGVAAERVIYLCEFIILMVSIVFTNYSITNFLRSREKEFGLLSLFGLTKNQIRNYILFENMIVSTVAIITGLIGGILFSKLFFMTVTVILTLDAEIPFTISHKAILITLISFTILFQGIALFISYKIKNSNIIELLKGSRIPKPIPKFSKVKAISSILLIASGYIIAVYSGLAIVFTMFPILFLVILGTYLLYAQFTVFFTDKLKQNKGIYYKGIHMITISQIVYKLKDNAKILFIASILSAVTLTATISVYSTQQVMLHNIEQNLPHDFDFIERGLSSQDSKDVKKIDEALKVHGHEVEYKNRIILIEATNEDTDLANATNNKKDFYIISNSDYNVLASQLGKKQVDIQKGEVLIHTYNIFGSMGSKYFIDQTKGLDLMTEGGRLALAIRDEISGGIMNDDGKNTNTAVVSDETFNSLLRNISDENKLVYYGYGIKGWDRPSKAVTEIKKIFPTDTFTEKTAQYLPIIRFMTFLIFIGTFISILFFISTSGILYFKIFNEIQKDRHEFISLKKMGVANDEMKTIISTQCGIMFLLPFVVALSHSVFAIKSLSNILGDNLSGYFLVIASIYLGLQLAYFVFARTMYVMQIDHWVKG